MPFRRHREGGDVCAIYVHAGAGFHSYANEKHHLMACAEYVSPDRYSFDIIKISCEQSSSTDIQ